MTTTTSTSLQQSSNPSPQLLLSTSLQPAPIPPPSPSPAITLPASSRTGSSRRADRPRLSSRSINAQPQPSMMRMCHDCPQAFAAHMLPQEADSCQAKTQAQPEREQQAARSRWRARVWAWACSARRADHARSHLGLFSSWVLRRPQTSHNCQSQAHEAIVCPVALSPGQDNQSQAREAAGHVLSPSAERASDSPQLRGCSNPSYRAPKEAGASNHGASTRSQNDVQRRRGEPPNGPDLPNLGSMELEWELRTQYPASFPMMCHSAGLRGGCKHIQASMTAKESPLDRGLPSLVWELRAQDPSK
ncbi:hypothetical protein MY10362_005837 [Beauveria mimosiformis]